MMPDWENTFVRAERLSRNGAHDAARDALTGLLAELSGAGDGPEVVDLRPMVAGLLGTNALAAGDVAEAQRWTAEALAGCEANGDVNGVRVYRETTDLLDAFALARSGTAGGARMIACRRAIAEAQDLADDGECERSTAVLSEVLAGLDEAGARRYRAKVLGQIGWNAVHTGDLEAARDYTEAALAECYKNKDDDGVRIYTANLEEIRRRSGPL